MIIEYNQKLKKLIRYSMKKFSFVCDLNKKGAKSKPFKMSLDDLQDEIAISYDAEIGDGKPPHIHEQFTGHCIPYIDVDLVESEGTFGNYEKYRKKKIKAEKRLSRFLEMSI